MLWYIYVVEEEVSKKSEGCGYGEKFVEDQSERVGDVVG